ESDYDVHGALTERKIFDESGTLRRKEYLGSGSQTYLYDNAGRLIEIHAVVPKGTSSSRAVDDRSLLSYDAHGSLTEIVTNGPDGSLIRQTKNVFVYDDHGNWIRKTETELNNVWQMEPFPAAFETIREFRRAMSYFPEANPS